MSSGNIQVSVVECVDVLLSNLELFNVEVLSDRHRHGAMRYQQNIYCHRVDRVNEDSQLWPLHVLVR